MGPEGDFPKEDRVRDHPLHAAESDAGILPAREKDQGAQADDAQDDSEVPKGSADPDGDEDGHKAAEQEGDERNDPWRALLTELRSGNKPTPIGPMLARRNGIVIQRAFSVRW